MASAQPALGPALELVASSTSLPRTAVSSSSSPSRASPPDE